MGQVLALGVPVRDLGGKVRAQVAEQENRVGLYINTHPPRQARKKKKPHQCLFGLEIGLVWDAFGFTNPRAAGSELL